MAATDGAPPQGTGLGGRPSAPVSVFRWRRTFPGDERQAGVLRRWLTSLLPDCPARDDVACVATELGTNALRHTASGQRGFTVEVTWYPQVVRIAVEDSGAAEGPRVIDDPAAEHGRGLRLVKGMSARMGVCGDHRGRLVWADVPWDEVAAAGPASPEARYEAAICDGEAALARRFAGVPAWFGRSTLAWWALVEGNGLVSAPSARELAALLHQLRGPDQAQSVADMRPRPAPEEMPASHSWHPDIGSPAAGRWRRSGPARVGLDGQVPHRDPAAARRAAADPRLRASSAVPQACA